MQEKKNLKKKKKHWYNTSVFSFEVYQSLKPLAPGIFSVNICVIGTV